MKRKFGFGDIISSKSEKTAPEDEYLTKINHNPEAIKKAEDRELFKQAMAKIGLKTPESYHVNSMEEGMKVADELSFPLILKGLLFADLRKCLTGWTSEEEIQFARFKVQLFH